MGDPATIEHYETSVPYYTLAFDRSHSRHLDGFLDRLLPDAHILELGCGTGRDAARMLERSFTVDATDAAPAMAVKAKERHKVSARVMRFNELTAHAEYQAVWAHACLMHANSADIPAIIRRIETALKPGGLHYASFKTGAFEGRDDRGRWTHEVQPEWIEQRYYDAGFELLELTPWQGKGADGVTRDWVAITARKV